MARTTLAQYAAQTDARLDRIEAGIEALLAAKLPPAEKARTRKSTTRTRKAQPKAAATKALTKGTRVAFIAAAAKDGHDCAGMSTWDLAFWAVSTGYAPKGFHVGERYTALAVEAGA